MTHEQKFLQALKDVFIGAPVEGESGYINLMRIKARYFEQGIAPRLLADVRAALTPFPTFREELFDKLYSFFHRYFSESGSIYFRYTPLHQNVYARVYTDDRDVMLFWKTHMLYYVKTDRLFQNMEVKVDNFTFYFDVSALQHKQANEKRALVFDFAEVRADDALVFTVTYSERGSKTKMADIQRALRAANTEPREEVLERAFRLFERQSEVDYFINKDARAFLREQFDLWMYQYVFSETGTWTAIRVQQLQVLRDIAYKLIDFIAQFEDELVKVWNKPKFVRGSHYVVTLDRLVSRKSTVESPKFGADAGVGGELLRRILAHPGMAAQVAEWRDLGMVGEDFRPEAVWQRDLFGQRLDDAYQYLPLDTRHFPDVELEILGLFDDLDEALDGWLVHSENYQALRTLEPKFRAQVKVIYIDPPYNTGSDGFIYRDSYRHASWLSMMENRLRLARETLAETGAIAVSIDDNESAALKFLMDNVFGDDNSIANITWEKRYTRSNDAKLMASVIEHLLMYRRAEKLSEMREPRTEKADSIYQNPDNDPRGPWTSVSYVSQRTKAQRPNLSYPVTNPFTDETIEHPTNAWKYKQELYEEHKAQGRLYWGPTGGHQYPRLKKYLDEVSDGITPTNLWKYKETGSVDDGAKEIDNLAGKRIFDYPKPTSLIKRVMQMVTDVDSDHVTLDFFAGSGTTAHAVMNLNREDGGRRKYILVEMGEHFETVILPRVKKVAFSDKWKDGQAQPGGQGLSHFVKVYSLEQYEDALRLARYEDADLFHNPYADPYSSYVFLRDLKMLEAVDLDTQTETVAVHLDRLYPDIDVAETLSCVTGKPIKRITAEAVEFRDGTRADLVNPEWELVKPLIWW